MNLTGVTIPNSVTNIGSYAFAYCGLTALILPGSVQTVGDNAFQNCHSLTNLTILNGVTSIGNAAFYFCTALTNVVLPNSVTNLGSLAFANCPRLASITLSASLTRLAGFTFNNCSRLANVTIPTGITVISNNAFQNCTSLLGVYFKGDAPSLGAAVFNGDTKATVYYLPGTSGWGTTFGGLPAILWNPQVQTAGNSFGVRTNKFGFVIAGSSNLVIIVEGCTNLAVPNWSPAGTNTLTNGFSYFGDARWTNFPGRYYRLRSP